MDDNKDETVKLCKLCSEEIKKGAIICIHCNSFQDWRRFLTISNTTLALLIALITVISSTVPPFLRATERPHSRIKLQFLEADQWSIYFSASNLGNRKGTIKSVVIWVYYEGEQPKKRYTIVNAYPCRRSSHHSEDNIPPGRNEAVYSLG